MKRWIVIANCQAFGLASSISSLAPQLVCDGIDVWQFQRQMRENPGFYRAHYDFAIVSEEVRLWYPYEPSDLPPFIDIPNFTFSAFHPDCCYVTAEGKVVDGVVGPYHSMIALAAYKEHLSPVDAVNFFNEAVFEYAGFFDLWEEQRNRLVTQFAAAGVSIGPALRRMSHGNSFMFTVDEIEANLVAFLEAVKKHNPRLKVLLTVSPVPLAATYEDRSVLVSTIYSKSVLRVAAENVRQRFDWVDYFPSYEIIVGSPVRGLYYEDDDREVSPLGVAHVMRLFVQHFIGSVVSRSSSIALGEAARTGGEGVVCDEALITETSEEA